MQKFCDNPDCRGVRGGSAIVVRNASLAKSASAYPTIMAKSAVPERADLGGVIVSLVDGGHQSGEEFSSACRFQHDDDAPIPQLARQRALSRIKDGGREVELAKAGGGFLGSAHDNHIGAGFFESNLQIEREHGLVLDDEDDVPTQINALVVHGWKLEHACDAPLNGPQPATPVVVRRRGSDGGRWCSSAAASGAGSAATW
jgi:hypothetical protein